MRTEENVIEYVCEGERRQYICEKISFATMINFIMSDNIGKKLEIKSLIIRKKRHLKNGKYSINEFHL